MQITPAPNGRFQVEGHPLVFDILETLEAKFLAPDSQILLAFQLGRKMFAWWTQFWLPVADKHRARVACPCRISSARRISYCARAPGVAGVAHAVANLPAVAVSAWHDIPGKENPAMLFRSLRPYGTVCRLQMPKTCWSLSISQSYQFQPSPVLNVQHVCSVIGK